MERSGIHELQSFEELAASFALKELAPKREENDRYPFAPFFNHVLDKAHEVGFFGITLPEALGGVEPGIRLSALSVILENISKVDASLGGVLFTHALALEVLSAAGMGEILQRISRMKEGLREAVLAFPSFTNPSETPPLAEARKGNGAYTLSGRSEYVVLAGLARHSLLPARIRGHDEFSFFLTDLSERGVSTSEPVLSLGLHACPAVDVTFNSVQAQLIGQEKEGPQYFSRASDTMQVAAAAIASGIMKGSFQEALAYTKERLQGGKAIVQWSEVKTILSKMSVSARIAEMIVAQARAAVDRRDPGWELCARAAAIHLQELACAVTTDGVQLLGGYGYMKDYGQEKRFRDAKQVQSLLGLTPMKRIRYIEGIIEQ